MSESLWDITDDQSVLSVEESDTVALISARWPWGNLIPAIIFVVVINLWRNSWSKVVRGADGAMHLFGGGREFVNDRFLELVSKCVLSPWSDKPIVDEDGGILLAIRKTNRAGKASPKPDTHPAWVYTHTNTDGWWVSWKWLSDRGLVLEKTWWGEHFDGEKVRQRLKTIKEVYYQPCLLTQSELDELRSILFVSQIAEEAGVVKSRALTVRKDGSIELGILPWGPQSTEGRDLYQEVHDKGSDDTRTRAKAVLEQKRTDTLPWLQAGYDGGDQWATDIYTMHTHSGYDGVPPMPEATRDDNMAWARPKYRLGPDILVAHREGDGSLTLLREKNVIDLGDGTCFVPKGQPTRNRCVRKLESFTKDGKTIKYVRYGELPDRYVELRYRSGLIKRIDRSIKVEIDGMLRGLVESGNFRFVLVRRRDEHASTIVHRCRDTRCPSDEHGFNDKGYAHVCGASGSEYWMTKALVIVDRSHFPFLELRKDVDCLVAEIYGPLVGELLHYAPQALRKQVGANEVFDRPSPVIAQVPRKVKPEPILVSSQPDPRFVMIMGIQAAQAKRHHLEGVKARIRANLIRRGWMRRPLSRLGVVKPTFTAKDYEVD